MPVLRSHSRLGPYTVVEMLRIGGMSSIYLADWQSSETTSTLRVAVKVANTTADVVEERDSPAGDLESFYFEALSNEVEVLKKLRHPHIVHLFAIPWGIKKDPYIARATSVLGAPWFCVMEYLEGGSVTQMMEEHGPLEPKIAIEIAYQVTTALDYMHAKGYAHLDVKPDNILLRQALSSDVTVQPQAVLIDFGIARRHHQRGLEAGSLPYMPPELLPLTTGALAPELLVSAPPVDVYAVGVLLYQMLTGHLPFTNRTNGGITTAIQQSEPTRPSVYNPAVGEPLEDLILQAMQKAPGQRPTAQELALMLDGVLSPRRFCMPTADAAVAPAGRPRRNMWSRVFAGTTAFLALTSLAQALVWGPLRPPGAPPGTPGPVLSGEALPSPSASLLPTNTASPTPTVAHEAVPAPAATALPRATETQPPAPATATAVSTRTPLPSETPRPTPVPVTASPSATVTPATPG